MKTFVVMLLIAFANVLLIGQTRGREEANPPARRPAADRLDRLSKGFPPELAAPTEDGATVSFKRSNCVYPSPATRSLSIKPCPINPHQLHIVAPFERGPATR